MCRNALVRHRARSATSAKPPRAGGDARAQVFAGPAPRASQGEPRFPQPLPTQPQRGAARPGGGQQDRPRGAQSRAASCNVGARRAAAPHCPPHRPPWSRCSSSPTMEPLPLVAHHRATLRALRGGPGGAQGDRSPCPGKQRQQRCLQSGQGRRGTGTGDAWLLQRGCAGCTILHRCPRGGTEEYRGRGKRSLAKTSSFPIHRGA